MSVPVEAVADLTIRGSTVRRREQQDAGLHL
jgi:hypothetical protein